MTGLLFQFITILTTLFALLMGILRLAPAPAPDLTAVEGLFVAGDDCPAGCMFGIRPDTTRLLDAIDRLEAHAWVGAVFGNWQNETFNQTLTVYWRWSGQQPAFINADVPGSLVARSYSGDRGHLAVSLTIPTHVRLYDWQHMLGPTSDGLMLYDPDQQTIRHNISYHNPDILTRTSLIATVPCPARLMAYWRASADINFSGGRLLTPYVPPHHLAALCEMG